jgi:hypothetical protein
VLPCILIEPNGVYDDDLLCSALEIGSQTLADARRSGALRYTRKGRRVLYVGVWILAWLTSAATTPEQEATARA